MASPLGGALFSLCRNDHPLQSVSSAVGHTYICSQAFLGSFPDWSNLGLSDSKKDKTGKRRKRAIGEEVDGIGKKGSTELGVNGKLGLWA